MSSHYDVNGLNRMADRQYGARQQEQIRESSKDVAKIEYSPGRAFRYIKEAIGNYVGRLKESRLKKVTKK